MKKTSIFFFFTTACLWFVSCKKYLDAVPDNKLAVIHSLEDLNSLLSNYNDINYADPGVGEASSDNNFLTEESWASIDEYERALCTWQAANVIRPYSYYGSGNCWADCYDIIYIANIVLDDIDKIERTEKNAAMWDNIKGQAFFLRAKSFLFLASVFCLAYDSISAESDLGLPLRLSPDFNEHSIRAALQETYNQIEKDFKTSIPLLPETSQHVMIPGKSAAFGFLSRMYIYMRKYDFAGRYADSALLHNKDLLDYNSDIQLTKTYPFAKFNVEVIYSTKMAYPASLQYGRADTALYNLYSDDDIRKVAFYRNMGDGFFRFRGSYEGVLGPFTGLATDELYITKSECIIREGKIEEGMLMLNNLLIKRWHAGTYIPYAATSMKEALDIVLLERRKELAFREIRWMDIKRLNKENRNINISRKFLDVEYMLHPNSPLYAIAIPEDVINRTGMQQNPR